MVLGFAVALPIYALVGPDEDFLPFALFMGVAMSITAFPVLARILVERRMLKRPVGALALACAAIDDVTAWFLIALATAVAVAGLGRRRRSSDVGARRSRSASAMVLVGRPLLGARLDRLRRGRAACPALWIGGDLRRRPAVGLRRPSRSASR